jgi:predicted MFS family arabinose efflux permease
MGFVLSSYFAALIVGIPLSAWIAETWGWRSAFLMFGFSAGLLAALSLTFTFASQSNRISRKRRTNYRTYIRICSRRGPFAALLASFFISGGTLSFLAFISAYLDAEYALGAVEISKVFLVTGVAAAMASPLSGWLCDSFSKRGVFLTANSIIAVPLVFMPRSDWGWPLFVLLFSISLGISFRQTALQTLQTELTSPEIRGSYLALRNCFSQLGISVATFLSAIIFTHFGYAVVTVFAAGLTLFGSLVVWIFVREPE